MLGTTGVESAEAVRGLVAEVQPALVIAVDALASRRCERVCTTVQLSDTGIVPGSGVGNHRCGLNEETLHVPVIGIGIPMVVDAGTIVHDAVSNLLETLEESEIDEFLAELVPPALHGMCVTPKDIDETVRRLSFTVSEGINQALKEV